MFYGEADDSPGSMGLNVVILATAIGTIITTRPPI
jgi:hypothetical protein